MKIGIIGMGRAGHRHAMNAIRLGHTVYAYENNITSANAYEDDIASGSEVELVLDRASLLQAVEAVVIATPTECHLDDMRAALAAGKHVLVEKPMALARQRAAVQQLVELNRSATQPLVIAVGYNLRFHPLIKELRDMLTTEAAQGRLPFYASFACCQHTDSQGPLTNGCLEDWATHEIDLAEHLLGPLRVFDHHVTRFTVDLGLIRWDHKGPQCHVHIHSDMVAHQRIRQLLICTERLSQRIDLEQHPVTDKHYRAELAAFVETIRGVPSKTLASGEDGVLALRIAERASV